MQEFLDPLNFTVVVSIPETSPPLSLVFVVKVLHFLAVTAASGEVYAPYVVPQYTRDL